MVYKLIDEDVSVKDLEYMVRECNSYDGSLEDYCYEINDEDFFNVHFTEPMEAVRAAYFGEYQYSDDYVRFNAYGNLKSVSTWDFEQELKDGRDEIVERYIEMLEDNSVSEYEHLFEEVEDDE